MFKESGCYYEIKKRFPQVVLRQSLLNYTEQRELHFYRLLNEIFPHAFHGEGVIGTDNGREKDNMVHL